MMEKNNVAILLVEDDQYLGMVVRDYLNLNGYSVDLADDGKKGWDFFLSKKYDLCILDIMLPERDGFMITEMIRAQNETIPIIILTAKASMDDKLKGFKIGADDYIIKPFNIEELVFRIEVFLKRSQNNSLTKKIYLIGKYIFDYQNLFIEFEGATRNLTQKEADLLKFLCIHKGEVVKREEILNSVWNNDDYFTGRSLDVFISRLRKYLKDDANIEIQNFHSVGFKLNVR
jgi:DNA-binding response OmpR family regulator